jgi:hypothetical protein
MVSVDVSVNWLMLQVVNALLTQLDKLKTRPNVLVLTTSNIPDTIDSAFIDRADEKFFVDYPPPEAVYWILKGCLEELSDKGMMRPCGLPTVQEAKAARTGADRKRMMNGELTGGLGDTGRRLKGKERKEQAGSELWGIAGKCYVSKTRGGWRLISWLNVLMAQDENLAGRFLRRLPLLAHSHYLSPTTKRVDTGRAIPRSIEKWLWAFGRVVEDEIRDRARVGKKSHTTMVKEASRE